MSTFRIDAVADKYKVDKVGEDEKQDFSSGGHDFENESKEKDPSKEKVAKLIRENNFLRALELLYTASDSLEVKEQLLAMGKLLAGHLIKKEMIGAARFLLLNRDVKKPGDNRRKEIHKNNLAEMVHEYSKLIKDLEASIDTTNKSIGKAFPAIYQSAGYLVHYCKDVLGDLSKKTDPKAFKASKKR